MLVIYTKCGYTFDYFYNVTNVRLSKNELRWTNVNGEPRSMALAFIESWKFEG
jgi:hypothetical protein